MGYLDTAVTDLQVIMHVILYIIVKLFVFETIHILMNACAEHWEKKAKKYTIFRSEHWRDSDYCMNLLDECFYKKKINFIKTKKPIIMETLASSFISKSKKTYKIRGPGRNYSPFTPPPSPKYTCRINNIILSVTVYTCIPIYPFDRL